MKCPYHQNELYIRQQDIGEYFVTVALFILYKSCCDTFFYVKMIIQVFLQVLWFALSFPDKVFSNCIFTKLLTYVIMRSHVFFFFRYFVGLIELLCIVLFLYIYICILLYYVYLFIFQFILHITFMKQLFLGGIICSRWRFVDFTLIIIVTFYCVLQRIHSNSPLLFPLLPWIGCCSL